MEINDVSDMLQPGIGRKCTKNIMNRRLLCHLDLVVLEKKREVYNSYIISNGSCYIIQLTITVSFYLIRTQLFSVIQQHVSKYSRLNNAI